MIGEGKGSVTAVSSDPLWQRIEAFDLDQPGAELDFSERLRRDHAWATGHGSLVVAEYRRFLYLLATSKEMLTPSEDVDEAWHLHMTYTRSYWDDLCAGVLVRPLHHTPTEGGPEEEARFRAAYARTLEHYSAVFGSPPPDTVWPDLDRRFDRSDGHQTVRKTDFWVIPRYWSASASQVLARIVPIATGVAAAVAGFSLLPDDVLPMLIVGGVVYAVTDKVVGRLMVSPNAHATRGEVGADGKPLTQSSASGCGGSCGGCGGCGG